LGILKNLLGNKPAAPPAPPSTDSRLSYQKIMASMNEKSPHEFSVKRCEVCGASFTYPDSFLNLATTNIAGIALDIGGFCPECRLYVCPKHGQFAQVPPGENAPNAGAWRPACAACGTFLIFPKSDFIRVEESMVLRKGKRQKLSLKALLEEKGLPLPTKTCGECGKTFQHPARDFVLARVDKKIGPADFEVDLGGHCQCCGTYVCGAHAVLFEHENEGRQYLSLTCAICAEVPLSAEVHEVKSIIPGVEWKGCWHKSTKKAVEEAMKKFSAPPKQTFSFENLAKQNNIALKDKRCDACGETFKLPAAFITPQMDLKMAQDNQVTEENFVADVGGYCHTCRKYFCPKHVGVLSTDVETKRIWTLYCSTCVNFLTPDKHIKPPQG